LKLKFADKPNGNTTEEETHTLALNEWVFWSFSLDYENNSAKFHFSDKNNSINKVYPLNDKDISLREHFEIDLGCFPTDFEANGEDVVIADCKGGVQARDTYYTMESFDKPELLYALSHSSTGENTNINFDKYEHNGDAWLTNQRYNLNFDGDRTYNQDNNGLLHFKGTNSFDLELTPENNELFKALSIDFHYKEPLPDTFSFFKNLKANGETYSEVVLEKNGDGNRIVKLLVPDENLSLELANAIEEGKDHQITFSNQSHHDNNYLWIFNEDGS
jgi:hypothetical protein